MKKYLVILVTIALLIMPGAAMADYTQDLIPTMTSDSTPLGLVTANYSQTGNNPWEAFDDNTAYESFWWTGEDHNFPYTLEYDFGTPKVITKYTIMPYNYGGTDRRYDPSAWTFEGWDGAQWVTLDSKTNQVFTQNIKNEYTFDNTSQFTKYRIKITDNQSHSYHNGVVICEMEMMSTLAPASPANHTATAGNAQVSLSWTAVTGATSYNVKRATTSGGPYTTIASSVSSATYTDTTVTNGTTYYYVVTAVSTGGESGNSNEASATPQAPQSGNKALLVITMTNGSEKEYDLTMTEVNSLINWYNSRASGSGTPYYIFSKTYNQGPFLNRKDYIIFDKILNFEVMEY